MEYQKITNLLDDTANQRSEFMTRNSVEITNKSRGTYNDSSQIELKASSIRSTLCD